MISDYLEHKLTNTQLDTIDIWFHDRCYDLYLIGESEEQQILLKRIQKIVEETGATNLLMAVHFMQQDELINELCQAVQEISETLRNIKTDKTKWHYDTDGGSLMKWHKVEEFYPKHESEM